MTAGGRPGAAPREETLFAAVLGAGTLVSVVVLIAGFLAYVLGVVPPRVPIAELPRYWGLDAPGWLRAVGAEPGWGWLRLVAYGDFLSIVGIAMLGGVSLACYAAVLPVFLRKGDTAYAVIALLELAVLLLAASGLVVVRH